MSAPARSGPLTLLASFVLAAWILGGAEGALVRAKGHRLAVLFADASFTAVLGLAVAIPVTGAFAVTGFLLRRSARFDAFRARFLPVEDAARRTLIVERMGRFLAGALVLPSLFGLSLLAFGKTYGLQEVGLAKAASAFLVVFAAASAVIAVPQLGRPLSRLLVRLDRRRRLRLPPRPWLLFFACVTVPCFATLIPILQGYAAVLGVAGTLCSVFLLFVLTAQIRLAMSELRPRLARTLDIVLPALAIVGVAVLAVSGKSLGGPISSAGQGALASIGASIASRATDFDRDGASSLFGGADCAPFDGARSPSAAEVPGNGVDEDCDGIDGKMSVTFGVDHRFSDALPPNQVHPYNVVWIVMETVRADHVSALGYDKPTMPFVEELANESLLFTNAYSQASATVLSVPSMLSGIDPGRATWHRERNHPQLDPTFPMLAERLGASGYKTGLVYDVYLKNNFLAIQRGFEKKLLAEPDQKNVNNRPRRNLFSTAKAAEFLAGVPAGKPFFLVVYYPDQHSPYTRHPDVDSSAFERNETGDYDTELRFADEQLRALVELLKSRPEVWDDTIVVINSDHGEELGEHGGIRHAKTCWEEVVHVPLIVRIPGIASQRIDQRVGLIDVVPTILEMTGNRADTERLSGQSLLVPALAPARADAARPLFCNIASITDKYGTFFRRAVRDDQYTLVNDVLEGSYALFDHRTDRYELDDISKSASSQGDLARLRSILDASLEGNLADHRTMIRGENVASEAKDAASQEGGDDGG